MDINATSELRPTRPPIFGRPSARQIGIAIAVLVICAIAAFAALQVWKARDLKGSSPAPQPAATKIETPTPSEPADHRANRFQRILGQAALAPGGAQDQIPDHELLAGGAYEGKLAGSTFEGLAVPPSKEAKELALHGLNDEYASLRAERMAVRNIKSLRATLEITELDVYSIYQETAAQFGQSSGPNLTPPNEIGAPSGPNATAETHLYTLFGNIERFAILNYAATLMPIDVPVTDLARFTSHFGSRTHPITGESRMHSGADFAAPTGAPVIAAADGEVVFAGVQGGYGETIRIRHKFGLETVYAHLKELRVEAGDQVQRGMWIGDMGSTGRSTGSHLHYEVRLNGAALNPMKFIEAGRDFYGE